MVAFGRHSSCPRARAQVAEQKSRGSSTSSARQFCAVTGRTGTASTAHSRYFQHPLPAAMSLSRRPTLEISIADSRKRSASVSSESPSTPPGALNYPAASSGNASSNSIQLLGIDHIEAEDPRSWGSGNSGVFRTRPRAASMPEKTNSLVSFADEHECFDERAHAKAADQMSSSIPIPSTLGLRDAADDPETLWEQDGSFELIRNEVRPCDPAHVFPPFPIFPPFPFFDLHTHPNPAAHPAPFTPTPHSVRAPLQRALLAQSTVSTGRTHPT